MKVLSLFSNIGVAEARLNELNIDVVIANELIERRAKLYNEIYPETKMIIGDIKDKLVFDSIVKESIEENIDIIMATPPCQGMSTVGTKKKDDDRNTLILPVLEMIKTIKPKHVFLENVPGFLKTEILVNEKWILIIDLIKEVLSQEYHIEVNILNSRDYGVPQSRERAIILLSRKDKNVKHWLSPVEYMQEITMEDAIGKLPSVDPILKDVSDEELNDIFPQFHQKLEEAKKFSKWHVPPVHIKRQVQAMMYTPTGKTAFDNEKYYPKKENGDPVKGYRNTYKRQNWDTPAYTITMDNRKISSQNNVHPGRYIGKNSKGERMYSDARALTIYEIMKITSLPDDWNLPDDVPEAFLRSVIGEGIPPLFVKTIFEKLVE
ncbi:MAG TPA: DNA cytosine methyltransferase [Jeotgalicoccus sp.]|nr:DNA cytosine methyltransferase [Jeotgalicoccus sp.]